MIDLPAQELRVLGCLVEKQLTTPQQYPLTLNALTLACNQSSNRFPVVSYDERTVEGAVTSAKTRGLARFVHPSHGRSAIRFAHTLDEVLGLDGRQLALLAVLMFRGPQTPGELRSRTERMASFDDLAAVERDLGLLAERSEPLVVRLRRRAGTRKRTASRTSSDRPHTKARIPRRQPTLAGPPVPVPKAPWSPKGPVPKAPWSPKAQPLRRVRRRAELVGLAERWAYSRRGLVRATRRGD